MREEISAEEKKEEFICADLALIRTSKFHKYIFQLRQSQKKILQNLIILKRSHFIAVN